jgi:hypothetical protein
MAEEGHSWRKDLASFYKAQREDLRKKDTFVDWTYQYQMLNKLHSQLNNATNWFFVRHPNLEADDIIAIAVRYFKDKEIVIVSGDKDLFQLAYGEGNHLFTHAGVHFGWFQYVFTKAIKGRDMDDMTVAEQLNEAFRYKVECLFDVDWYRGGFKKVGGPLWVDKQSVGKKPLKNTHQYCGHSPVSNIYTNKISDSTSITFCDVLHHKKAFYTINI